MKIYSYQVVWEDENDQQHSKMYGHFEKEQARAHYDQLPREHYKALWQVWRNPYGEQLMIVNNPRRIRGNVHK